MASKWKTTALKLWSMYQQHVNTKVKLCVGFFQISSLLSSAYQVPYPYTYLNFQDKIQIFSLDFAKATPGPCIFGASYRFSSKVYTIGSVGLAVYVFAAAVIKGSPHETEVSHITEGMENLAAVDTRRECNSHEEETTLYERLSDEDESWAQKALPWLSTGLFLLYPGFSAEFFDVLKCRTIDAHQYVIADLSIECSGAGYSTLRAFAIFWVVVWACGMPLIALALLWPVRSQLRNGAKIPGFQQHLSDFYSPYRPAAWYFEVAEYTKKLLLIGIIPAIQGDVMGAVIAMLIVNVYLILLVKMEPFASRLDNSLAICLNALLSVVILISVLLKMDSAYLSGQTSDGFDIETAVNLLVTCNVLVVVVLVLVCGCWLSSKRRVMEN
jgi:hypothetical protein